MMSPTSRSLSRRDFLKLSALSLACLAAAPLATRFNSRVVPLLGRVTVSLVYIYEKPDFASKRVGKGTRDQLLSILEEILSPVAPPHNPLWYRCSSGYVHSAHIQRIRPRQPAFPLDSFPENGALGEVIIPYTRSFRYIRRTGWQKLYRLYFSTVHWITGVDEGPDGQAWYRIKDHLLDAEYYAPAAHLSPISQEKYSPLSPDIPAEEKRIDISIKNQTLIASEAGRVVYTTTVSSGIHTERLQKGEIPTDTPLGSFRIQMKMPSRHMGDGRLTSEIEAYELPGVPWTSVFHEIGVALHGTYWHNNFGQRMSHGCVNLRNADALWLFRWSTPVFDPTDFYTKGPGTLVVITEK